MKSLIFFKDVNLKQRKFFKRFPNVINILIDFIENKTIENIFTFFEIFENNSKLLKTILNDFKWFKWFSVMFNDF